MSQNQALADASLRVAECFLGEQEKTGQNDGPFVETVEGWYYQDDGSDRAPWCATFRSFCDWIAGQVLEINLILPRTDSSSDLYVFAKDKELLLTAPIPGCVGLLRETDPSTGKTHKHTFKVRSIDADGVNVNSIDGNESNMVRHAQHLIANCDFVMCC